MINSLKNISQQEKNNLLQQLAESEISAKDFKRQITDLKQQAENLTRVSQQEKSNLASKISDLEQKLTIAASAEVNYQKSITELEKELKNAVKKLSSWLIPDKRLLRKGIVFY